jgi:transcriptional regulator with XRE-family HTH domain
MKAQPIWTARSKFNYVAPIEQPQPMLTDPAKAKIALGREVNLHVARQVKKLRVTHGRTQTDLGWILGMTFQQIAKYEQGISKIAPDKLWGLSQYFGVEISYFFEGFGNPTSPKKPQADGCDRLRLELAAAIHAVKSPQLLRSLLALIRLTVA